MQFNLALIATALFTASTVMAAKITPFAGADCTGASTGPFTVAAGDCFTLGTPHKSIRYENVPNAIKFFTEGKCPAPDTLTRMNQSGCATAPTGFDWESVRVTAA